MKIAVAPPGLSGIRWPPFQGLTPLATCLGSYGAKLKEHDLCIRGWHARAALRMHLLPPLQHPDKFLDPLGPGLGLLGVLDPVEDGVAVVALQRGEKGRGVGVGVELPLE